MEGFPAVLCSDPARFLLSETQSPDAVPGLQASATPSWPWSRSKTVPSSLAACNFGILLWELLEPVEGQLSWSLSAGVTGTVEMNKHPYHSLRA